MSPRWLTIEKLVTELGGVCSARAAIQDRLEQEPPDVEAVLREATHAVAAALASPAPPVDDSSPEDEVVRCAWTAIAVAQDRVAQLTEEVQRARGVCQQAQDLQEQSLRLRLRNRPPSD
jgi:hypothetical protein